MTIHIGARLGNNNEIFPGASISTKPQDLKFKNEESICEIGDNNSIRENVTISRGTASKGVTKVGNNNLLMECVHVAHDCVIGSGDIIGNATKFAGEVTVDDNAIISANILCHQFCHIGGYVMVQGGSRFSMDIPPYIIVGKEPARYMGINLIDFVAVVSQMNSSNLSTMLIVSFMVRARVLRTFRELKANYNSLQRYNISSTLLKHQNVEL